MPNKKLLDYIRQQMAMGTTEENIQKFLATSGWSQPDIDAAFAVVANEPAKKKSLVAQIFRGIFWALVIIFLLAMIGGGFLAYYVLNQTKSNIESGQATKSEKGLFTAINAAIIQSSLMGFNLENKKYPLSLDELAPRYILQIPIDPATNQPYRYSPVGDGVGYNLCTIKNGQDICATASTTIDGKPLDY